jgi:Ni/Co efflux regulator RcnB
MKRTTPRVLLISTLTSAVIWAAPQWAAAGSPPFYRGGAQGEPREQHEQRQQGGQERGSRRDDEGRNDGNRGDGDRNGGGRGGEQSGHVVAQPPAPPPPQPVLSGREGRRDGRADAYVAGARNEQRWSQPQPRNDSNGNRDWRGQDRDRSRVVVRGDYRNDNRNDYRNNNRSDYRSSYRNDYRGDYRGGDRGEWRDARGRDWNHDRGWYDRYRAEHYRYDGGRYRARQQFYLGYYNFPRGYSSRLWLTGQWLPYAFYDDSRYHIDAWWQFDLYDPPFGADWIRVGSDALLVDIETGEILDVIYALYR